MRKDVAHATHSLDVVAAEIGIAKFFANLADVHVDAAVKGGKFATEDGIDQVFAGNDVPCFTQQGVQQVEFDRGQFHRLAALANNPGSWIQFNITHLHDIRNLLGAFSFVSSLG